MQSGKAAYREFLKTDFWLNLSREKKRLVPYCEQCRTKRSLQAHHVHYPRNWLDTTLEMLRVLCRTCHKRAHGFRVRKPKKRKRKWLARQLRQKLRRLKKNKGSFEKPMVGLRFKKIHHWQTPKQPKWTNINGRLVME